MSEEAVERVRGRAAGSRWLAFLLYTVLRVALLIAVWALIAWLSPVKGLWALALALLVSGGISFFVLDRLRDSMSMGIAGFFSGINARIEASARAEDGEPIAGAPAPGGLQGDALQDGQAGAHDEPVREHEDPGALERRDE